MQLGMSNNPQQPSPIQTNFSQYAPNYSTIAYAPPQTNEYKGCIQKISIMLFILLLIPSATVILYYALPLKVTIPNTNTGTMINTIIVSSPSLEIYTQLSALYPQTLQCPCSQPAVNYEKFIQMEAGVHQVCSSYLVDQVWIDSLQRSSENTMLMDDFRSTGSSLFQALRAFCELSQRAITNDLKQFLTKQYLSTSARPPLLLNSEIESLFNKFRSSLADNFLSSLAMIRDMIQVNALFSALGTNFRIGGNGSYVSAGVSMVYDGCRCSTSPTCTSQSSIYDSTTGTPLFDIPGLYTGCYVTEALLRSTLECFYDQQCIDTLQSYLMVPLSAGIKALDPSLPSRYSASSTIKELVDNLMIEQWDISLFYEKYYNECLPSHCTYVGTYNSTDNTDDLVYTFEPSKNIIHIVIIILGTIGGLAAVLQCIVALLVIPIMHYFGKNRRNVLPTMSTART